MEHLLIAIAVLAPSFAFSYVPGRRGCPHRLLNAGATYAQAAQSIQVGTE